MMKLKDCVSILASMGVDLVAWKGAETFGADGDNELFRFGVSTNCIRQLALETGCWSFSASFPHSFREAGGKKRDTDVSEPRLPWRKQP